MRNTGSSFPSGRVRTRILGLIIGLVLATLIILSYLAISSIGDLSSAAGRISTQALTAQAETYLVQLAQKNAREYDQALTRVLKDAQYLADFIASVYEQESQGKLARYWKMQEHMSKGDAGQLANSLEDQTSVFVPNLKEMDENVQRDIEVGAFLELAMPALMERNPNVVALYFATPNEVTRYYPNINLGAVLPPDFRVTQRLWYLGSTSPQVVGSPYWSSPYVDATGKGLVTTASQAVLDRDGNLLGVVGMDITLNEMKSAVESMSVLETGYTILVDQNGFTIAFPQQGYLDFLNRLPKVNEFSTDLKEVPQIAPVLDQMLSGKSGLARIDLDGKELLVAYAPLPSTGWSLAAVAERQEILGVVAELREKLSQNTQNLVLRRILPFSVLFLAVVIGLSSLLTDRLVRPIQEVTSAFHRISQGDLDFSLPASSNDELGSLAMQFQEMKERLRREVFNLERQASSHTRELERKNGQLHSALQVARELVKVRNLPQLLNQAVGLIGGQFGFYHVGIYLADPNQEYVLLQAAYFASGQSESDSILRVKVNPETIVGYVASTGAVYVADALSDALYIPHPLLPETRSELALPLRGSRQLLGVLDIHSKDETDFSPEQVAILQNLADHLSAAIENVRALQEPLERVQPGWRREAGSIESHSFIGYQYDMGGVNPIQPEADAFAPLEGKAAGYQVPLKVRGETVALLNIWPEGGALPPAQVELINNLSERIGQAMESAILYEETQARATREQLLNQFISRLSRTLDLDSLLRESVRELGQMPGVEEASIFLRTPESAEPVVANPVETESGE